MGPQTASRWSYGFAPGMILLSASVAFVLVMGGGSALALGGFFPETFCTADPCLGTDGVDLLGGTAEAETIDVLAGDDFVNAWRGGDAVYGREGNDELDGHYGNDTIYGGPGNDLLYGAAHSDTVYGGTGEDRIRAEGFDSEGIGANPRSTAATGRAVTTASWPSTATGT